MSLTMRGGLATKVIEAQTCAKGKKLICESVAAFAVPTVSCC